MAATNSGTAYGLFNSGYGLAWFAGSATMGWLYDLSLAALIAFSLSLQLVGAAVFLWIDRRVHQPTADV